jgi:hypothetical protein
MSLIQDPEKFIPDPGGKKAPDPGSGSATLIPTLLIIRYRISCLNNRYFNCLSGSLPWQGIITPSMKEKYKRIKNAKMKLSLEELCQVYL